MKEKIYLLIKLQDCDNRIAEIIRKKSAAPLEIKRLENELEAAQANFREEMDRLQSLKKERRKLEQEIQEVETRVEKSYVKLSNIKSNKEYTAALKEVEDLKTAKTELEDKTLQIMEQIENLENACRENEQRQVELKDRFEKDMKVIEKALHRLEDELKVFERQRENFHQQADQGLLNKYALLLERKDGKAISPVIKGICQTCHIGMPPQKFNELIKGDVLMTCPNCYRIIYWGEDEKFQTSMLEQGK